MLISHPILSVQCNIAYMKLELRTTACAKMNAYVSETKLIEFEVVLLNFLNNPIQKINKK